MAKVKMSVSIDESRAAVLGAVAGALSMTPGAAAGVLLSAALASPAFARAVLSGSLGFPGEPAGTQENRDAITVPWSVQTPLIGTRENPGEPERTGENPAEPTGTAENPALSSSLLFPDSDPEKKKRPILTDEQKKARAEGKAKKEEADRLFDEALALYAEAGARVEGAKADPVRARRRWHELRLEQHMEARELLARVRRFVAATKAAGETWPGFAEVLLHKNNYLTDMGLGAREKRAKQGGRPTGGQVDFTEDAYDERIARARRASDPIPRPSAGATRPARAGGLPGAPQAPSPVQP